MRARKLGRWALRLTAVAALGAGAGVGTAALVSADELAVPVFKAPAFVETDWSSPGSATPDDSTWD